MIDEPNLNCARCYQLYDSDNLTPSCKTPQGCHIQDVAADLQINRFCEKFVKVRLLYEVNEISSILEAGYKELGLLEEPDFLFMLEKVWAEFRREKQKEGKMMPKKWNKVL